MYRLFKRFSTGILDTSDDQCSGRPIEVTATSKFHIENVKEILNEDRRCTCDELAESVGISLGSV